ncbi:MAG TPA: hypothetical protein VJ925_13350 [Longimicrobiales bacterium]|nr:hypothetical protein [Longimicrobiales bacterium]
MDVVYLIGIAIVLLVVFGLIRSRAGSSPTRTTPRVVTRNLDYTILGQRPEIVTEDEDDPQSAAVRGENGP